MWPIDSATVNDRFRPTAKAAPGSDQAHSGTSQASHVTVASAYEAPTPPFWGSRGRRFKSGRPDWLFERLYPELGTKIAHMGTITAAPRAGAYRT